MAPRRAWHRRQQGLDTPQDGLMHARHPSPFSVHPHPLLGACIVTGPMARLGLVCALPASAGHHIGSITGATMPMRRERRSRLAVEAFTGGNPTQKDGWGFKGQRTNGPSRLRAGRCGRLPQGRPRAGGAARQRHILLPGRPAWPTCSGPYSCTSLLCSTVPACLTSPFLLLHTDVVWVFVRSTSS